MPKRVKDWNEGLAVRLKDKEYAREFILACLDEGIDLVDALAKFVRSYGVVEYAQEVNMPKSNLFRVIRKNSNPTLKTLKKILAPLDLDLGLLDKAS
jgi:DNA-binding phage protein